MTVGPWSIQVNEIRADTGTVIDSTTIAGQADTTQPSQPTNLTATAPSSTRVDLGWTASTDNVGVSGYDVYRDGTLLDSVGAVATYTDGTVQPNTTYSYAVQARDAANNLSLMSDPAQVTTPSTSPPDSTPPSQPTNLSASAPTATRVELSWTASTDDVGVSAYDVFRDGNLLDSVGAVTTYTDDTVQANTTYSYTVQARDAAGNPSIMSDPAQVTTPPAARTYVFSDGFESANLSQWTTNGGLVVQNLLKHSGTWAAQGNTTNGATYAKKLFSSTYADGYLRTYFYLASGYTGQVNILRYRTAADASLGYVGVSTSGKLLLRNDIGAITTTSTSSVSADTWHSLELHVMVNGTASATEVWLDGVRVSDLSWAGQNWGTTPIGKVQIGEVITGRTYNVTFDDVAFDTSPIGP